MAAPNGITWGSEINGKGRIGIYAGVSSSQTETTVSIEVWCWTKFAVQDSSNNYYYNANSSSATTNIGSININHTSNSGSGWSTVNQTKLGSATYKYARGTSAVSKNFAAKLTGIDWVGGTMTCTKSVTIPALSSYSVSYNANGGSGAPGIQTKYYGINVTLSMSKPMRSGYIFKGWSVSAGGGVSYASGAVYSANSSITLYAVWEAVTYSVTYNANGGSGAPGAQTKYYGNNITLSTIKPTRINYTFKGWSVSAGGGVSYASGAVYSTNSSITLYAVWELAYEAPYIKDFKVTRCNSDGALSEVGSCAKTEFYWECCQTAGANTVSSVKIAWLSTSVNVQVSGTSGKVTQIIGANAFSTENSYIISVTVTDSKGGITTATKTLGGAKFPIDFKKSIIGGVAIGKPAEKDGYLEVAYEAQFNKGVNVLGNLYHNGKSVLDAGNYGSFCAPTNHSHNYAASWASSDTGRVNVGYGNGISTYGEHTHAYVRKVGRLVELRGIVTNSTTWSIHDSLLKIPEGYRPTSDFTIVCQGSGSNRFAATVKTNGNVSVERYSNNTTTSNTVPLNAWLNINVTYFI